MFAWIHDFLPNGPTAASRFKGTGRRKRTALLYGLLDTVLILVVVASVLLVLDDSSSTLGQSQTASDSAVSFAVSQQLPTDPLDPLVTADITIVRTFRKALQRELTLTNAELLASSGLSELVKRRYVIEKMLTNGGGTGLNDRLAEIDKAISVRSAPSGNSVLDESLIKKAIQDIHQTAVSCKTGPLSEAAKYIGSPTP